MDSIIRQSIHRFGVEKDVFASRFAKNIFGTFQHLLQCKEDEKVCEENACHEGECYSLLK